MTKAKLAKLREFADGQPVDVQAADRYRQTAPDVDRALRLAASPDPKVAKVGRLRCAAILAAVEVRGG